MYEVMARRYRPSTFSEVVGQEAVAETLKNAITRNRVAHAYLFTGGHGCGKTTMARILAKALVCVNGPTAEPCGKCSFCIDVARGKDTDVLEIDGASNNGVEQIRQLREQAVYVPTKARFKIYIIDEVHMLSDGAFNALLKTLEEPPAHVKFILATTDPHKIPETILSRCQRFDFRLLTTSKLVAFFKQLVISEKAKVTDEALEAIAAFSGGSVRDGLVLLDQLLAFSTEEITRQDVESVRGVAGSQSVADLFSYIQTQNTKAALEIIDLVAELGINVGDFLDQLIEFARDLMYLLVTKNSTNISAYGPAKKMLEELVKKVDLETCLLYLDVLTQTKIRLKSRALTNPVVCLEMAIARLAGLGGFVKIDNLLNHLDNIVNTTASPLPASTPASEILSKAPEVIDDNLAYASHYENNQAVENLISRHEVVLNKKPNIINIEVSNSSEETEDDSSLKDFEQCQLPKLSDFKHIWQQIVKQALSLKLPKAEDLVKVHVVKVQGDLVSISADLAIRKYWEDPKQLNILTEIASEIFNCPAVFQFVDLPEDFTDMHKNQPEKKKKNSKAEIMQHPVVQQVSKLFNGTINNYEVYDNN